MSFVGMVPEAIALFETQREEFMLQNQYVKESGKTDDRLQPSYHIIAAGLRKENKFPELAQFLVSYGQFVSAPRGSGDGSNKMSASESDKK